MKTAPASFDHDPEFGPFWDACRSGRLMVQQCAACETHRWPPRAACAHCLSTDTRWTEVRGEGTLYSWVVVHRTGQAELKPLLPFTVVVVALDERPEIRFLGILVDAGDGAPLKPGMPMRMELREDHTGQTRPYWRSR